ncbi:hypothetical protein [Nocardioides marmorisolisilvae]|uniref:hypothetical protein n=1 Tax=Nocardioides marmorisolisilvae TaxID=1542737 RepID=UPI00161371E5|nr:hypothetical protein [Nocardioides marmorisolisilvae]
MRRIIITLVLALAAIGCAAAIASAVGGGTSITRARLERSLPATFANQYVQQAALLGHTGITPASLQAKAMCEKGGPGMPDKGPGSDWICLVGWQDPNVPMPPEGYGKFELTVHSNDCYTAGGPSKLVGFQTINDTQGRTVNNPVFEFDGCFDPNGDDQPTGNSYPSVLQVTSTVLSADVSGRTGVQVSCGAGANGCAGVMTISDGTRSLGSVHYDLQEQATPTLSLPQAVPVDAQELTFTFAPSTGIAPPKPTTIPVQR